MTNLETIAACVQQADAVLVAAGAGLSAAAGLDYTDEQVFAHRFPGMLQYGARCQYQLMGYPFADEALKWGYLSVALDHVYRAGETAVYQQLRQLIGTRDYFVITSNVDRYFHKNGFDNARIYTPQGDYEWLQCMARCHDSVWPAPPHIAAMLPYLNRQTQRIEADWTLPACPRCGGPVFMNVRGGGWFVEQRYQAGQQALQQWLSALSGRLVILELGVGYNTPGVIRFPMERLAHQRPDTDLVRINRDHASGPEGVLTLAGDAAVTLPALLAQVEPARL